MKSILFAGLFLLSTHAFSEDKDPLMAVVEKKEEKAKFDLSLKNLTKAMNNPKTTDQEKLSVLNFFKDTDIEVYKAFVAQETKKEKTEKKAKQEILDGFSNDSALLAGCEMSYDRKVIYCGDREYRHVTGISEVSSRVNTKTDLDTTPEVKRKKVGTREQ